jgi:hypothetical protein
VVQTPTWRTGDTVAALPIVGGYAEYLCLPSDQLVPVPYGLDPAEVVSVILKPPFHSDFAENVTFAIFRKFSHGVECLSSACVFIP